jgi:phospholipid/cholesterol/gamma-HCH transport system ATP-binding protein
MPPVLQFSGVGQENITALSFSLEAGQVRVLRVDSKENKNAVIELAIGERMPDTGVISLHGAPLDVAPAGSIGWVPANGGLISNLKTWENVTLPLWYHGSRSPSATEDRIKHWLTLLEVDSRGWEDFMASPSGRLKPPERKLAGLLRGLVQSPPLLVVDAALFDGVERGTWNKWVSALNEWVGESNSCALVVAEKEAGLPWEVIAWSGNDVTS